MLKLSKFINFQQLQLIKAYSSLRPLYYISVDVIICPPCSRVSISLEITFCTGSAYCLQFSLLKFHWNCSLICPSFLLNSIFHYVYVPLWYLCRHIMSPMFIRKCHCSCHHWFSQSIFVPLSSWFPVSLHLFIFGLFSLSLLLLLQKSPGILRCI